MNSQKPVEAVVERIRYLIRQSRMSQAQFARRLSIDPSNLSKHLSGRLPVTDVLLNRIVVDFGVSKQWLRDGTDLPFSKTAGTVISSSVFDAVPSVADRRGVPVYDIDVTAGTDELSSMFTVDRITGYISLPRISCGSLIVHVSGDSMKPDIIDGGFIAIRPVTEMSTILWGQIYVVVTDDFRRVKSLRRHPGDETKVILHSSNPDYDDVEINRSDIRSLFRVEAILNCKICG